MYDLPLGELYGKFGVVDLEANKRTKEVLESKDFREKLVYYNENIQSLSSHHSISARVSYEWSPFEPSMKIYCGCDVCRKQPNFDPEHERIFLELRAKEVERLLTGINKLSSYKEKLGFLMNTKGYMLNQRFTVYPNIEYNETAEADPEEKEIESIIDLTPASREERRIYNEYVKLDFDRQYIQNNGFTQAYTGFNFKKEKERLVNTLKGAVDPKIIVDNLILKIEKHFGYPDSINKNYDERSASIFFDLKYLFAKRAFNINVDLDNHILFEDAFLNLTHVEEIVRFYRYLKQPIQEIISSQESKGGLRKSPKLTPTTLLELWTKGESHYDKVIEYLKEEEPIIQSPFVTGEGEDLTWVYKNYQYVGAFIKKCMGLGYVKSEGITSKQWVEIINNTFNLSISSNGEKLFRPKKVFDSMYLDAFHDIPHP